MDNAIEIRNLTKSYKDFSLHIDSLDLPKGCIMGLVGSNGAGKTTLIKSILDLNRPQNGDIKIFGKDSHDCTAREDIGVVFDDIKFNLEFTVREVRSILKSTFKNWDDELFTKYLNDFKLPEKKKKLKEFSRGMKMKLSLAAALAHHPKLLLLDEATSGIDPIIRDDILDIFLEFIQDEEHSILVSSHIITDIQKAADYVTFINDGKIVFTEEKDVLLDKYRVVKCGKDELADFDSSKIIGKRTNSFGAELLMLTEDVPSGASCERAEIEEIMLLIIKNEK